MENNGIGTIILSGIVNSSTERESVEQAVRSCPGVSDVQNQIQVKEGSGF